MAKWGCTAWRYVPTFHQSITIGIPTHRPTNQNIQKTNQLTHDDHSPKRPTHRPVSILKAELRCKLKPWVVVGFLLPRGVLLRVGFLNIDYVYFKSCHHVWCTINLQWNKINNNKKRKIILKYKLWVERQNKK